MTQPIRSLLAKLARYFDGLGEAGAAVWVEADLISDIPKRLQYLEQQADRFELQRQSRKFHRPMVDVRTFVNSPFFMVGRQEWIDESGVKHEQHRIWPTILADLTELNSGKYTEAVLTGAIGAGKTTLALWTLAYQLYVLSCYRKPHQMFDLDPTHEIAMVFQSLNKDLAKTVDYRRFRAMIEESPYFKKHFDFDHDLQSEMKFPNQIVVKPISGYETGALGQNVIGGLIDEMNFMAHVENSKMAPDRGLYDQAVSNYESIARRRESRFLQMGELPGMLCLVSSSRYRGQFTDQKIAERNAGNPRIFVYHRTVYEVRPERFSQECFEVFPGDEVRKPFIVTEQSPCPPELQDRLIRVPVDFRRSFEQDLLNALRDIAGVSTTAVHPFILDPEKVVMCFGRKPSVFGRDVVDFVQTKAQILPSRFDSRAFPRFVHLDLAVTQDSAGFCMGYVERFVKIERGQNQIEILPVIVIDGILEIRPPIGGEIQFEKIRELIYTITSLGVPIRWVTCDSYQSRDMVQILRHKGYTTGIQSIDVDTKPYDVLKNTLYDGRLLAPPDPITMRQILQLERDVRKGKIDHPPNGAKDKSDALAGVVYGLSIRREIWAMFEIQISQIPSWLIAAASKKAPAQEVNPGSALAAV